MFGENPDIFGRNIWKPWNNCEVSRTFLFSTRIFNIHTFQNLCFSEMFLLQKGVIIPAWLQWSQKKLTVTPFLLSLEVSLIILELHCVFLSIIEWTIIIIHWILGFPYLYMDQTSPHLYFQINLKHSIYFIWMCESIWNIRKKCTCAQNLWNFTLIFEFVSEIPLEMELIHQIDDTAFENNFQLKSSETYTVCGGISVFKLECCSRYLIVKQKSRHNTQVFSIDFFHFFKKNSQSSV